MATKATDTETEPTNGRLAEELDAMAAAAQPVGDDPRPEGEVPVAAHVRRAPGGPRQAPADRISDLEAEVLRLQLAIVQTAGDMRGAHLNAAREYVQGVLDDVVEGRRKLTRELADHLGKSLASE